MSFPQQLLRAVLFTLLIPIGYTSPAQNESFIMTPIGPDHLLSKPWDLHYGPDGYLWVTERKNGIVRINPETAERDELIQIPDLSSTAFQDGLLGLALHDDLLNDNPYVYVSYTHLVQGERKQKIVRFTYEINADDGSLSSPMTLIDNLPSSNDHNSGRLIFGPDEKLYYTIGDQGSNQGGNYCNAILSQVLPTQTEIDQEDWTNYPGKILRLNTDGSIPTDNPILEGVQSHIYSYGHRNAQGIVFGNNGLLYSDEHGPSTDDEVNIIYAGDNYGWPNVAGYQDDQAYDYCNWSSAPDCQSWDYLLGSCPPPVTFLEESSFMVANYQEPLFSMFAVPDDFDFDDPACSSAWVCRPNVAPSSIGFYGSDAIPAWKNSLLVVSLKRGRIYRLKLDENGTDIIGDTTQHFYTPNRYRDMVIDPDGKSFYVITDDSGRTSDVSGLNEVTDLQNRAALLKFTLDESVPVRNQNADTFCKIWPNPASDRMYIELKETDERNFSAELINSTGKVIMKFNELRAGINETRIDDIPAGVYFFKVYSKNYSWYKRVLIF